MKQVQGWVILLILLCPPLVIVLGHAAQVEFPANTEEVLDPLGIDGAANTSTVICIKPFVNDCQHTLLAGLPATRRKLQERNFSLC